MSNKYLEKIASFKGFRANREGIRDLLDAVAKKELSRSEQAKSLLNLRQKVRSMPGVEMEPGFSKKVSRMIFPKTHTDIADAMFEGPNVIANYPKGVDFMRRLAEG